MLDTRAKMRNLFASRETSISRNICLFEREASAISMHILRNSRSLAVDASPQNLD
jgi:hypothetical protein